MAVDEAYFPLRDHQLAGIIIFVISLIGMLGNWLVATTTLRLPTMRSSFGCLLTSQSISSGVACTIFASLYSTMLFFDLDALKRICPEYGSLLLVCYNVCLFSHFFISLNRMCAIHRPFQVEVYFSRRNTYIIIAALWAVSVALVLIPFFLYGCHFTYSDSRWAMAYTISESCEFVSTYSNYYRCLVLLTVIGIVDIATITKVRLTNIKIRSNGGLYLDVNRGREINFLKQAVLHAVCFLFGLFCYFVFVLSEQWNNKWAFWSFTSVSWNLVYCLDAFIVIALNAEFRKIVVSPKLIFSWKATVNTVEIMHSRGRRQRLPLE